MSPAQLSPTPHFQLCIQQENPMLVKLAAQTRALGDRPMACIMPAQR
ncbi:hypothetical protein ACQ4M4_13200 [Leptolyngbya sp. AN02str]